jgi:hypothetical protein
MEAQSTVRTCANVIPPRLECMLPKTRRTHKGFREHVMPCALRSCSKLDKNECGVPPSNRSAYRASRHAGPGQGSSLSTPTNPCPSFSLGRFSATLSARLPYLKTGRYLIVVDGEAGASTSNVARELTGPVLIRGLRRRKPQHCGVARLHFHSCSVGAA